MSLAASFIRYVVSWVPPKYICARSEEQHRKLREKYHIIVDGEDIPPPIEHFAVSLSQILRHFHCNEY